MKIIILIYNNFIAWLAMMMGLMLVIYPIRMLFAPNDERPGSTLLDSTRFGPVCEYRLSVLSLAWLRLCVCVSVGKYDVLENTREIAKRKKNLLIYGSLFHEMKNHHFYRNKNFN